MSANGKKSTGRPRRARGGSAYAKGRIEPLEPRQLLAYTTTVDLPFNVAAGGLGGTGFDQVLPSSKGKGFLSGNVALANGALQLTSTGGDLYNNNQDDPLVVSVNG